MKLNDSRELYAYDSNDINNICFYNSSSSNGSIERELNGEKYTLNNIIEIEFTEYWNLKYIPNYFMAYAINLSKMNELPSTLENIGRAFLHHCESFNSNLIFPENLKVLGDYSCQFLNSFNSKLIFPSMLSTYSIGSFHNLNIFNQQVIIPSGMKYIGKYAFQSWFNYSHPIIIPDTVESIGESFFSGMNSVTEIYVPNNFLEIINDAIQNNPWYFMVCNKNSIQYQQGLHFHGMDRDSFNELQKIFPNGFSRDAWYRNFVYSEN